MFLENSIVGICYCKIIGRICCFVFASFLIGYGVFWANGPMSRSIALWQMKMINVVGSLGYLDGVWPVIVIQTN